MVAALDAGVAEVEAAYKAAGMWDDTVTIFSAYQNHYKASLPAACFSEC